ncbi:translation initiation factor IF-2 N-terminal domain-containing protein, partial [Bhargavaea beijingensis]|uniref:translation initiation factor IF-2 N-terminal domain-containing protein n=1 Tax=Bhargavaea beijingensis TaxID=426756 RepID=UPI0022249B9D
MTKMRVHEYAKKVNKSSREVIDELDKMKVDVKNHMSVLDSDTTAKLDRKFGQGGSRPNNQGGQGSSNRPASQGSSNRPASQGGGN